MSNKTNDTADDLPFVGQGVFCNTIIAARGKSGIVGIAISCEDDGDDDGGGILLNPETATEFAKWVLRGANRG